MVPPGGNGPSIQYLLRTVRIGIWTTAIVLVCLAVFPFLPGHGPLHAPSYAAVLVIAGAGGITVALMPWRRLFETGLGQWALYAWSAFDIALVAGGVAANGAGSSELWIIFGLTTLFFAASYPLRAQVALLAATMGSYLLTIGMFGLDISAARLFLRLAVLGLVALLASYLSRELMHEMSAHSRARDESERAAGLLVRLLSRLVNVQEDERVRVGRELHDELGQLLTSILHYARRLEHDLTGDNANRAHDIVRVAERALAGTRSLVRTLRPVELDQMGLVSAIRRLAYDLEDRHALHIAVRSEGLEDRLPPNLETAAYRIVQEALTNVVRHANARAVDIDLVRRDHELLVTLRDDGMGFDPARVNREESDGVGLIGMLERARLVGGEVWIESAPGQGTLVRLRAPIRA
ncbi:MAG: sensor histidine kinase [Actinomycetota bacterium]